MIKSLRVSLKLREPFNLIQIVFIIINYSDYTFPGANIWHQKLYLYFIIRLVKMKRKNLIKFKYRG